MMDPSELHTYLTYDPETGELRWKERPRSMFSRDRTHEMWNTRYEGKLARGRTDKGCLAINIGGRRTSVGRVCWAMHYGEWPEHSVEFRNKKKNDFRIANLVQRTHKESSMAQRLTVRNTSGIVGVSFDKAGHRWRAMIKVDGKKIALGSFVRIEDAAVARREAEVRFGFAKHMTNASE